MSAKFIFWAQALDNSSPDHIEIEGEELGSDDLLNRQKAVSLVSRVIKSGNCVFSECGVRLTVDNQNFVVEVLSLQQDRAGRGAPIICYGTVVINSEIITEALNRFAKKIGRSLQSEHIALVKKALDTRNKNSMVKMIVRITLIIVATLMTAIFWLSSRA